MKVLENLKKPKSSIKLLTKKKLSISPKLLLLTLFLHKLKLFCNYCTKMIFYSYTYGSTILFAHF